MEPKKLSAKQLQSLFEKIVDESDKSTGYYAYKDFKIKVVKPMTGSERYSKLYRHRRENGLCIVCGKKVTKKNPRTSKLYRLCETHRAKIDKIKKGKAKKKRR